MNLIKERKVPAWDMSTNTAKHNKTKQSFAKHGFVKTTTKKKSTIFYIATANFWLKRIIHFVSDGGKQRFLYITGDSVNGTNFKQGNLILSMKITSAYALQCSTYISKHLYYRYTHPRAK